jgi:hypothetical protein
MTIENYRDLHPLTPQSFRTWCEQFIIGYRSKRVLQNVYEFRVTMRDDEASGVLASPQFLGALRKVRRVNHVRLPFIGTDGLLKLLPEGYHQETETLTLAEVDYDTDMPLDLAVETVNRLLGEFCFSDGERSKAVAIAGMVGLFANQLLPEKGLRPCFILVANAEGAGKTLLVQIIILPTLGAMPVGSKADEEAEMRKVILTAVREGCAVIFLDNLKGRLSSPALEAFLSSPAYTGRKLGVSESISGDNLATVFVTGNGLTVSPDMRRRSLFVELHLEHERPEDRQFQRVLDFASLNAMRPQILAALWAMVRHWNEQGRPQASRSHSAFPSWANTIGGIVEAAGFACPLETANVTAAADPDGEDMRALVEAMAETRKAHTFGEVIELARKQGLFESTIGTAGDTDRRERTAFGHMLTRYHERRVLDYRFLAKGKGKTRLYEVECAGNDRNDGNDIFRRRNSAISRGR